MVRSVIVLAGLSLLAACSAPPAPTSRAGPAARNGDLLVAAAANVEPAFTEIGERFQAQTGQAVTFSFGSSGHLATQIENGAPFDVFAAANVAYVDRLRDRGLVIPETQQVYARGRLVLAVNRASGVVATTLEDLLDPAISRVAIANPEHAPYGLAARQALASAGLWERVRPKLVYGENVRQALQFVQTGNAPAGIVALSIAAVPEVTWTPIDPALHEPLDQAIAVVRTTRHEQAAREFVEFVTGPQGRAVLKTYGFSPSGEF